MVIWVLNFTAYVELYSKVGQLIAGQLAPRLLQKLAS